MTDDKTGIPNERFRLWASEIRGKLTEAGFTVDEYQGLPIVKIPESHPETVRLLKFAQTVGCNRTIYAEGMLFHPAGTSLTL
jgi:hypothetical protein